ncbi:unnamed protein product [Meganyctiphanes norvegica]|uniref:Uncharacterized protein n=1 Tax=Meganyctiphanes norvegica TaxID=48144 RepID=A0AAV2QT39_MEGNR
MVKQLDKMKIILVLSILACATLSSIEARDFRHPQIPGGVVAGFAPDTVYVQPPPAAIARLLDEKLHLKHKEHITPDTDVVKQQNETPVDDEKDAPEPFGFEDGTTTVEPSPVTPEEPYTEWWEILLIVVGFIAGIALVGLIIMIAITNIRK